MNDHEIIQLFRPLLSDSRPEDHFGVRKPLLAHYTSITTLEAILRNNEVWLSNPLFMNDMEEVRFGINAGVNIFLSSPEVEAACGDKRRLEMLKAAFNYFYSEFANQHVLDLYVFCLSEHAPEDKDGLLSMWRGYGGNGNGAALVFDAGKINVREESPLIVAHVHYGTAEERANHLRHYVSQFSEILGESHIPDEKLHVAAFSLFERIKLFSVFTKHRGFSEEKEWRVVYMRSRDAGKIFDRMFSYAVGPRGVVPKLKFRLEPIEGLTETDLSIAKITERIILGPSLSSPLALATVGKMLDSLGLAELKPRVIASTIPFRAG